MIPCIMTSWVIHMQCEVCCADLVCVWRSAEREIQELLEFRCVRRLRTVHGLLQEANGLGLLADPLMERATAEIVAGARPRHEIQRDIKQKERARELLTRKYKSSALPEVRSSARVLIAMRHCSMRSFLSEPLGHSFALTRMPSTQKGEQT
jgi:hypothetical protein